MWGMGVMKVGGERDEVRWQEKMLVNHPPGCFDGSKKNREWANMCIVIQDEVLDSCHLTDSLPPAGDL
jgi:hypothetical protein